MITVKCENIKKFYGDGENKVAALRGINLELFDKKLTLLVGPSGSGKTTLMSIIHTILTPDEGSLHILGQHMNGMDELSKARFRNEHMGVIFQALYLIPTLSVLENVILPLIIKGETEHKAKKKAVKILEQLQLHQKIHSSPLKLSRGQQQRVAIARALVNDPQIIMCDEPTSALDQANGFAFMKILRDLIDSAENRTVLVITHDHRIFPFADQIVNINDGLIEDEAHA